MFCLVENIKHVVGLAPQADGSLTSQVVSLKNVNRAWIKAIMNQNAADQCTLTLRQATDIAAGTNKAISNNVPIWYNNDAAAADALTKGTDAKTYQFSATQPKLKIVWFQIDPALALDVANDYDCIYVTSGGSSGSNLLALDFYLDMKYREYVLPSVITD